MSETSMSVATFVRFAIAAPANVSILLRANHGLGKSSIVRQIAAKLRKTLKYASDELPVIDRRLSQLTEGDIIGLPSTDGEVTRFNPPDWYKKACLTPCVLFLDELNRATTEVMQAAFQIVLDRELNGWKLHPETRVFSAINNSAEYTVNEMDPALLDRFWCIDLAPTFEDWRIWATDPNEGNVADVIVDFITQKDAWLYTPKTVEPGSVTPSPRSWSRFSDCGKHMKLFDEVETNADFIYQAALGFVGLEAAMAFRDFCKNQKSQVSGEEIINFYSDKKKKIRDIVQKKGQNHQNEYVEKVTDFLLKTNGGKAVTEKQGKNLGMFFEDLPQELVISLWCKLTGNGVDSMELAKSIHPFVIKQIVTGVFGVPVGASGVGVQPNIPGFLKNKES